MHNYPPAFRIDDDPVDYQSALSFMEERVAAIREGRSEELIWLLEHPPLYTAGTSANPDDLIDSKGLNVYRVGRGGQFTYHGPGQRIAYVMLDLQKRGSDVRRFIHDLEEWAIRTLDRFNVRGERREDRVGVWVRKESGGEAKIVALGVRVRRWVSFHGMALNVEPDLSHYAGIVPCGIREYGVTSLADLGILVSMPEVDSALMDCFAEVFGDGD